MSAQPAPKSENAPTLPPGPKVPAIKVRHLVKQYLYYYSDNRLEKVCTDLLAKSDDYLAKNFKVELFNISRKFGNPLMERIHQEIAQGNWSDVWAPGYLATLSPQELEEFANAV